MDGMTEQQAITRPVIKIDVVSDLVSPWCYVGMRRLEQALRHFEGASEPEINWKPFEINPALPPEGVHVDEYLKAVFGSSEAGRAALDEVATEGVRDGIRFAFDRVSSVPNTLDAHRLVLMAEEAGAGKNMADRLFRGFFEEGRDIGRRDVLAELAEDVGMVRDGVRDELSGDRYRAAVRAMEARVRGAGLSGVPSIIVNRRIAVMGVQDTATIVSIIDQALFHDLESPENGAVVH
jgi:predicted DsbA family dithiol-disulfide isomerase